jgi:hypothetical protein
MKKKAATNFVAAFLCFKLPATYAVLQRPEYGDARWRSHVHTSLRNGRRHEFIPVAEMIPGISRLIAVIELFG